MASELIVPIRPAGPLRLRPFQLTGVDLVHDASPDPYIPLITLPMPPELGVEPSNQAAIRTAEETGFRRDAVLRSWQAVGGECKTCSWPRCSRPGSPPTPSPNPSLRPTCDR